MPPALQCVSNLIMHETTSPYILLAKRLAAKPHDNG